MALSMTCRLGVAVLFAATPAACADVLGIQDLPLASDEAGDDSGVSAESSALDVVGSPDASVENSATDAVGSADATTESAAATSSGEGGADVAQDAAGDTKACSPTRPCDGGCCDPATSQCVSGTASASCGAGGGACVTCADASLGHLCLGHGTCGCSDTIDCPMGLACQVSQYCGPGP